MTLPRLPDLVNVGKIAKSTRRELRCDQVLLGDEKPRQPALRVDNPFDAPFSRGIKVNAINAGKYIDAPWIPSKPKEVIRFGKILHPDVLERSAKRSHVPHKSGVRSLDLLL